MEIFKNKKPINFMSQSFRFGIVSIILVLASLSILLFKGLNYGIDFAGGTIIQIQYKNDAPINKIRELINKTDKYRNSNISYFGNNSEILIKTKVISKNIMIDTGREVASIIKETGSFEVRRVDMVGPNVGHDLKIKGILAMILAIIAILIYISFRFEWRFAVASVFALAHDIIIVLGIVALLSIDVNLDILAALLTILGYSLNDTIIVFDRIREGVRTIKSVDLNLVINKSVTRTLTRTTLTSLTTFFVVLTLFLFGGEILNGFSLTLLIGVVIGTYSSIFIASPVLILFSFSISNFRENEANKLKREKEKDRVRAMYEHGSL